MQNTATQIVLLGGGYVSIWAYRSLIKNLRYEISQGHVQITVICPEQYHFFHGWTAESLTAIIQDQNRLSPLSEVLSKAQIIHGMAEEIHPSCNTVSIKMNDGSRQVVPYDHILLGIGSSDNDKIEGLTKYGYQVKSHQAFHRTKQGIQSIVRQAAEAEPATAQRLLSLTIVGGGFSGVELATNIAEFITILMKQYPTLENAKPSIRLVNSGDEILHVLEPRFKRMRRYAEKIMFRYGIEVIYNKRISRVTEYGVHLGDTGSFVPSSMVICTIGQSRMILKGMENMERDNLQRIHTNTFLQVKNQTNIWGGGDACNVEHYKTLKPCPSNALWAIKHGEYAGRNIARVLKKKEPKRFNFKGLGQCASLGIGKGIGELYGIEFTGWIAWIMRWFTFNYFVPSSRVMLKSVADWTFLLFFGKRRDLAKQQNLLRRTTTPGLNTPALEGLLWEFRH